MQVRDSLTALSAGAQLWLLPPLEVSVWARKIDWYLQFQIRRAIPYRRFEFGDDMRQLTEAYEDVIPKIPRTEKAPLMIASANYLPNHQTVIVPVEASVALSEWVLSCQRVWKGLDEPAARVFLPPGLSREDFAKVWSASAVGLSDAIEVVLPL